MGTLLVIALLIALFKKYPPDRRRSDLGKWLIIGAIVLSCIPYMWILVLLALVALGIAYLVYKKDQDDRSKNRTEEYGWDAEKWNTAHGNERAYDKYREYRAGQKQKASYSSHADTAQTGASGRSASGRSAGRENARYKSGMLTESVRKRRKIVETFNKKYDLFLTDEQITSIVNSSYTSEIWRQEIADMNRKYNVINEWLTGPTAWLRAYMHVFHVQDITSDIMQQEYIVMYAFEAVFKYVDGLGAVNQSDRVRLVNNRFLTDFDDASLMVAYNFLKEKGINHTLMTEEPMTSGASDVDDLLKKYENSEGTAQEG